MTTRFRKWRLAVLCLAAAALAAGPAGAAQNLPQLQPAIELNLPAYIAELDRCSQELSRIQRDPSELGRFRQSLPRAWDVQVGQTTIRVSTAWLDSALAAMGTLPRGNSAIPHDAQQRLQFLREQALELERPPETVSTAAARSRLEAIFQEREFRGLRGPSSLELWWRRAFLRISDWLDRWLARLHLGAVTGNAVAYGLIVAVLIVLCLLWWRNLAAQERLTKAPITEPSGAIAKPPWSNDAQAAAERGDYREAIRCAYWAVVARLDELGALPRDRSRTPRELVGLLAFHPDWKRDLNNLTARFEVVWYGYRAPSAEDWQSTRAELEKLGCPLPSTAAIANS
jgi:hypothetical protein